MSGTMHLNRKFFKVDVPMAIAGMTVFLEKVIEACASIPSTLRGAVESHATLSIASDQ